MVAFAKVLREAAARVALRPSGDVQRRFDPAGTGYGAFTRRGGPGVVQAAQ